MEITRPNQVWAMDITYIPMERGFVYLAVVLDWATRWVLSWRLSITMEAAFCIETLEEALARHGKPEIFNTDQGSQGGLKRSSQHPEVGGCDERCNASIRAVRTSSLAIARTALRCRAQ
jgi:putative transposase